MIHYLIHSSTMTIVQKQLFEGVFRNRCSLIFCNIHRKHLRWSLFLIKFLKTFLKRDSNTGVFLWILEEQLFYRTPPVAASDRGTYSFISLPSVLSLLAFTFSLVFTCLYLHFVRWVKQRLHILNKLKFFLGKWLVQTIQFFVFCPTFCIVEFIATFENVSKMDYLNF